MSDDEAPAKDHSDEPSSSRSGGASADEDSSATSAEVAGFGAAPASAKVSEAGAGLGDRAERSREAPDPVVGIGLVILGVLVMGIAGAATLHYVFNIGTAIAIIGAVVFLVSVVLSSLKERPRNPGRVQEPRMQ